MKYKKVTIVVLSVDGLRNNQYVFDVFTNPYNNPVL